MEQQQGQLDSYRVDMMKPPIDTAKGSLIPPPCPCPQLAGACLDCGLVDSEGVSRMVATERQ